METIERHRVGPERALLRRGAPALDPTVAGPVLVVDDATLDPVIAVFPFPGDLARYRHAVMAYPMDTTVRSGGVRNKSRVFGYGARSVIMKRNACRVCAGAMEAPEAHATIEAAADALHDALVEIVPARAAHDREVARARVLGDWMMGERSPWTSGVVNKTSPMPYHYDRNNLPVWSAMVVARRGVRGGHLHVPEYDVVLPCRDGDVVAFPGWDLMHAVTPMTYRGSSPYRFTAVYYGVAAMGDCEGADDELAAGRARRTTGEDNWKERQRALGLLGDQ